VSDKPTIDAEYEVIEGPRLQPADSVATETPLQGWRLWVMIIACIALGDLALVALVKIAHAIGDPAGDGLVQGLRRLADIIPG
jgi:hypothetical protein